MLRFSLAEYFRVLNGCKRFGSYSFNSYSGSCSSEICSSCSVLILESIFCLKLLFIRLSLENIESSTDARLLFISFNSIDFCSFWGDLLPMDPFKDLLTFEIMCLEPLSVLDPWFVLGSNLLYIKLEETPWTRRFGFDLLFLLIFPLETLLTIFGGLFFFLSDFFTFLLFTGCYSAPRIDFIIKVFFYSYCLLSLWVET